MTPGSTTATRSWMLMSTMRRIRSVDSTMPPRTGSAPPVMPLPAPRGVTGMRVLGRQPQHQLDLGA